MKTVNQTKEGIDYNAILEKHIRKNKLNLVTKIWKDVSDSYLVLQEAKKTLKTEILEMEKDSNFERIKYISNLFKKYQNPKSNNFTENLNYVTKSKSYQKWKTKLVEENKKVIRNAVTETIILNNILDLLDRLR